MVLRFSVVTLVERWQHFSSISGITAPFHSGNDDVGTLFLSRQDVMHDFIPVIMLSLVFR